MAASFHQVALIGVGLIGGSLGMVMRRQALASRVIGFDINAQDLRTAVHMGAIDDFVDNPSDCVRGADLVVLAIPVGSYEASLRSWASSLRPGALVTDVGSVKGALVERTELAIARASHASYVGAHPIAGKEASGPAAASAGLFRGARCVVTPTGRTDPVALARIERLWEQVAALPPLQPDIAPSPWFSDSRP